MSQIETKHAVQLLNILKSQTNEGQVKWEYIDRTSDISYQAKLRSEPKMIISIGVTFREPHLSVPKNAILRYTDIAVPEVFGFDLNDTEVKAALGALLEEVSKSMPSYEQTVLSYISDNT